MGVGEVPVLPDEETFKDKAISAIAKQVEGDPFAQEVVIGFAELAVAGIAVANRTVSNIKSILTH